MKNLFATAIIAALTTTATAQNLPSARDTKALPAKPLSSQGASNPCAAFGPGFVRIEGSSSCVKIGGSISVEGGASRSR